MMFRASLNASIGWIGLAREAARVWDYPSRVTSLNRTEEKFGWIASKDREAHFSLRFRKIKVFIFVLQLLACSKAQSDGFVLS